MTCAQESHGVHRRIVPELRVATFHLYLRFGAAVAIALVFLAMQSASA